MFLLISLFNWVSGLGFGDLERELGFRFRFEPVDLGSLDVQSIVRIFEVACVVSFRQGIVRGFLVFVYFIK